MESLSSTQIKQYQKDGYLIVEIFLTEECEKLSMRCRLLVDFSNHSAVSSRRPNTEACPQNVKQVSPWSPCVGPRIQRGYARQEVWRYCIARSLQMVHPAVEQSMYIFKQPRFGGVFQSHQDSTYLYTLPMTLVGLALEILKMLILRTAACGFFPKSHKNGLGVKMTFTIGETNYWSSSCA